MGVGLNRPLKASSGWVLADGTGFGRANEDEEAVEGGGVFAAFCVWGKKKVFGDAGVEEEGCTCWLADRTLEDGEPERETPVEPELPERSMAARFPKPFSISSFRFFLNSASFARRCSSNVLPVAEPDGEDFPDEEPKFKRLPKGSAGLVGLEVEGGCGASGDIGRRMLLLTV